MTWSLTGLIQAWRLSNKLSESTAATFGYVCGQSERQMRPARHMGGYLLQAEGAMMTGVNQVELNQEGLEGGPGAAGSRRPKRLRKGATAW